MLQISQDARPLRVALGDVPSDAALLVGLNGSESLSGLFTYTLSLVAPVDAPLRFADVLGKPTAVALDRDAAGTRHLHGVIRRFRHTRRDARYAHYQAELVPALWLLTRVSRSRIFQGKTAPEIAREVIGGLYTPDLDLRAEYHPRKACAQYRESDFAFLSRLLEEEGIYYYFTHAADGHQLVLSDHPHGHRPTPGDPLAFHDHTRPTDGQVTLWEKQQELRTGGVAFTDHWFELPSNNLWATQRAEESVAAGAEPHDPRLGGMDKATATDHPWGGAHWRDGVAPGGADQPADLDPLFKDNTRIARVRLDQEQAGAVRIDAASTSARLTAGHKFTLSGHFDADGEYVAVAVRHSATCPAADSDGVPFTYSNSFECQPIDLPFRPQRVTPRPAIHGTQTGVVVGSDGAEIDPDKYGRVKVWFRWDPDGQRGLDTSCWVRVAQAWAGKRWGTQFLPRVGDEVVVAFENGDPDQPLVIGSVYNADNMPVFPLPANKTQTGIRTHSSPGGDTGTFNEIKFEDKTGEEVIAIHAQKDMTTTAENNHTGVIGTNPKANPRKSGKSTTTIFGDTSKTITKGNFSFTVAAGKSDTFVKGAVTETYDDTQTTTVTNAIDISSKASHIHLTSPTEIRLTVGGSTLTILPGSIVLNSKFIHFEATDTLSGLAPHVQFEGKADLLAAAPSTTVHGVNLVEVVGKVVNVTGESKATMAGGGSQTVTCDGSKVAVSGAEVHSHASGIHTVTGSLVKIN